MPYDLNDRGIYCGRIFCFFLCFFGRNKEHGSPSCMASRFYLSNADAIVFLLNALLPFAQYEREYIARYFAGRQMQNLFFVINRGNLFLTGEKKEELKQCVREELTDVFTDQKGTFDEELFRRRVFYVNALESMNTRLGRETKISSNVSKMISDDETGVPKIEEALEKFLTSSGIEKLTLHKYLRMMADFYIGVERSVEKRLEEMEHNALEKERIEANLMAFAGAVSTMSRLTTSVPLTIEGIKKLASGEED